MPRQEQQTRTKNKKNSKIGLTHPDIQLVNTFFLHASPTLTQPRFSQEVEVVEVGTTTPVHNNTAAISSV